ncbi:emp24/gp25L/p24 family/GOLD-domain-containing protein [Fimicolochytrium jonesii]|uniref:emp24/gp25L/p24 family/GOLD-domain-containing protein n=1 Tax=Fimicolochytrium jonesii TaxID=1396493 RepID=UPI0022FF1749|nr:emp24/gp25L/p24 family/GOLD-domain-containing protein [Fimicolochytrium jonesii]KAI8823523.1 emp24/gp25L/p24 family/GOLD-domain-containing protein [Fimicolochytrium jonesii]
MAKFAATTLTYKMEPHERACFYVTAKSAGEKMAFYFAVQSGGSFDVDYDVMGPKGNEILSSTKERQGDFVFSAPDPGEHSFCFSNKMSTFTEKVIDFDITAEHEQGISSPVAQELAKKEEIKKDIKPLEECITRLSDTLGGVQKHQKYFRTRENRNFDTVKSTQNRIFWFGTLEAFSLVVMGVFQVFIIQTFFMKSGKARV